MSSPHQYISSHSRWSMFIVVWKMANHFFGKKCCYLSVHLLIQADESSEGCRHPSVKNLGQPFTSARIAKQEFLMRTRTAEDKKINSPSHTELCWRSWRHRRNGTVLVSRTMHSIQFPHNQLTRGVEKWTQMKTNFTHNLTSARSDRSRWCEFHAPGPCLECACTRAVVDIKMVQNSTSTRSCWNWESPLSSDSPQTRTPCHIVLFRLWAKIRNTREDRAYYDRTIWNSNVDRQQRTRQPIPGAGFSSLAGWWWSWLVARC